MVGSRWPVKSLPLHNFSGPESFFGTVRRSWLHKPRIELYIANSPALGASVRFGQDLVMLGSNYSQVWSGLGNVGQQLQLTQAASTASLTPVQHSVKGVCCKLQAQIQSFKLPHHK